MIPEIKPELVDEFRRKVHENNNFIACYFTDYKGRNVWSKICSCMDWLTVATEGLEIPTERNNMNKAALEFTHFIVTLDMILEAVEGLWVSIGPAINKKAPNLKDKNIFQAEVFGKKLTDRAFFKTVRSWFGVHSVNGNEEKVLIDNKEVEVRFFSSWSTIPLFSKPSEGLKFSLRLYSNNPEAEELYGGTKEIKVNDLINFITLKFESLNQLMKEIDNLYNREKKKLQGKPINLNKDKDELTQLNQLHEQAQKRRLLNELYETDIELYKSFLMCDIEEFQPDERALVLNYLEVLKPIIPIYRDIIQNVDIDAFDKFDKLKLSSQIYLDNHYYIIKVLESNDEWTDIGIDSIDYLIKNGILPECITDLSGECRELLIYALDYKWSLEMDKK
ncbi:hypothetical protein COK36_20100 [Bacillus cereus]|uniref:hypothetical protein n=1 Tax=Bacillus cereus TaxID=1396 RepID=UPI000BF3CAB2|nr:hypothetical protein [Bacillus cereus]PFR59010.1 hypothetical protein COK36_20100 [Bacillus cereus]PGW99797.1 hypothetical protein COE19_01350 [Bacillus cereus]PGY91529.1 hypothetical protein COE38_16875 [Bacillus cereus]